MSNRTLSFLGFLITALLLIFSVYLQDFQGYQPCPLCTLQRLAFIGVAIFFLLSGLFRAGRLARIMQSLVIGSALFGLFFAGRQIWLQHFATNISNECGASLAYMLKILPANEVLRQVIAGSAECTDKGFVWLGIDTAEWSFIWFIVFLAMGIYLFVRKK